MQIDSTTVDTLTKAYSEVWAGQESVEEMNAIVAFMYSNDLIYVVLGVTLIIWSVLLFFMIRVDKKVTTLEEKLNSKEQ